MECYGNVFDEECVNLGSMFSCDQEGLFSNEDGHGLNLETDPVFWPSTANESNSCNSHVINDHILSYSSDHHLKSEYCYNYFTQESSSATDSPPPPCHDNVFQFCPSNELCMEEAGDSSNFLLLSQIFSDDAMEEILCLKQDEVALVKGKTENSARQPTPIADLDKETPLIKRKHGMLEPPNHSEEANENPKKKTRVSRDNKKKKNMPPKKNQKIMTTVTISNEDDGEESHHHHHHHHNEKITDNDNGRSGNVQNSSSCSSEGDSNALRDLDGETCNITVKTRAGRGAATDPQSIYARKRRERINERLRILQTLVPNGTKVDISTMLEEAVHYVKFLQLQIKLLSSDDTWMYAPIAYNGMDMGLYQNISQNL